MPNKVFEAIVSFLMALMVVVMTAMTTWLFKLDDRQFDLQSNVVTKEELRFAIGSMKTDMDGRFDRLETLIHRMAEREIDRGP